MAAEYGELGGIICPGCGEEAFRILDNCCMSCHKRQVSGKENRLEGKAVLAHIRALNTARLKRQRAAR